MHSGWLTVRGLHVYYGRAHVLNGVDLQVAAAPVALVGRNGMGKTTLCKALLGLVPVSGGEIRVDGALLTHGKPHAIANAGVGYVPQGRRIFPSLTVEEHLRLLARRRDGGATWTIERVYDLFPRLAERRRNGAANLSGGEQQMLAIGRALLTNPRLLVMDEPSEGLAPLIVDELVQTLKHLSKQGMRMFVVEQKLAVAAAIAERLLVMVTGRIALETTPAQLLADEVAQRRYLGVSSFEDAAL